MASSSQGENRMCAVKLRTLRATMAMRTRARIAGRVISLRSGSGWLAVRDSAGAVLVAGDPGHGDRLVFPVLGDQQPGGEVEGGHAGPAEQG